MKKYLHILCDTKPEKIFLIIGTFFGLLLMFITPIFQVPDEPMHLLRACEVANLVIHNNKNGDISKDILPFRKLVVKNNCSNFQKFKDIPHYTELFEFKNLNYTHNNSGYSFLLYLPAAAAIKTGSLFTENPYIQFYLGRLFNLIVWLSLTYLAIKITPKYKWAFLTTALFPMTVYEGMSLSADCINLSFAFLYIAFIFKLAYGKSRISKKQLNLLIFLSFITTLMKGLFLLIFLFLLIPKSKIKRNKYVLFILIILPVILLQAFISSNSFILIANNIDYAARKALMLQYPMYVVKLIINTLVHKTTFYVQSSIFRLGWLEIEPKPIAVISLFIAYLCSLSLGKNKINLFNIATICSVSILFVILTILLYFLTFSPLENDIIIGVQGRYFIPLYLVLAPVLQTITGFSLPDKHVLTIKAIILTVLIANLTYAAYLIIYS